MPDIYEITEGPDCKTITTKLNNFADDLVKNLSRYSMDFNRTETDGMHAIKVKQPERPDTREGEYYYTTFPFHLRILGLRYNGGI